MALQVDFVDESGVDFPSSYWMVSSLTLDVLNKTALINLMAWRDSAAKTAGLAPIETRQVYIGPDTFPTYFAPAVVAVTSAYTLVYNALMSTPTGAMFAGAITVP